MLPDPEYSDMDLDSLEVPQNLLGTTYVCSKDELLLASLHPYSWHTKDVLKTVKYPTTKEPWMNVWSRGRAVSCLQRFQVDKHFHDEKNIHRFQKNLKSQEYIGREKQLYQENSGYRDPGEVLRGNRALVDIPALRKTLRGAGSFKEARPSTPVLADFSDGIQSNDVSDFGSLDKKDTDNIPEDVFDNTLDDEFEDPSLQYFRSAFQPPPALKSALKSSQQQLGLVDDGDVYDPSLPPIPVLEEQSLSESKPVVKGSERSEQSERCDLREVRSVTPALDDWHETICATSRLGWALVLYHAVRNNFKPHAFARLAFQVLLGAYILHMVILFPGAVVCR